MKRFLAGFVVLAATLVAADVSGKWTGTLQGGDQERRLVFDLKADGATLTGTLTGLLAKPLDIKDGKVEADTVSFWVMSEWQGEPVKLVYKGKVSDAQIDFTMGTEDGSWSTEVVAKRAS